MIRRKSGQQRRKEAGERVINVLLQLLATANIDFSTSHNRQFGMMHFATILAAMVEKSTTAEAAVKNLEVKRRMPTAKWFLNKMHSISEEDAAAFCDKLLAHTVQLAKENGMLQGARIYAAIDKHLICRFDEDDESLVRSKHKNGTFTFETYGTVQAVSGKINAIIDCVRIVAGDKNVDFIRKFV